MCERTEWDISKLFSTRNCNRSLRYRPQLLLSNVADLATLEGSSSTDIMTCTGGCGYSFSAPDDGCCDTRNM